METLVFYLHLTFLALAACGIVYADSLAMRWMRGKTEVLEHTHLNRAHMIMSVALLGMVCTGVYLFWPAKYFLIHQPLFLLKMGFVITLIINSFFIDEMMHVARHSSFAMLTSKQKIPLFISGAVSTICWVGAGLVALKLFYF
jgi:hypothetical protein